MIYISVLTSLDDCPVFISWFTTFIVGCKDIKYQIWNNYHEQNILVEVGSADDTTVETADGDVGSAVGLAVRLHVEDIK